MSASLVGSEMCIRDSLITARKLLKASFNLPRVASRLLRGCFTGSFPERPVSYTHLTLPTICSV
eukprot:12427987-Alexandrium_andersonii.AAC.1